MTRKEKMICGLALLQAMDSAPVKLTPCARYILIYLYLIGGNNGLRASQLKGVIARDITRIVHDLRYMEDCGYIVSDEAKGKAGRRYKLAPAGFTIIRRFDTEAERRIEAQTIMLRHHERLAETQLAEKNDSR